MKLSRNHLSYDNNLSYTFPSLLLSYTNLGENRLSEICPIVITFIATKNKIDQYKIAVLLLH